MGLGVLLALIFVRSTFEIRVMGLYVLLNCIFISFVLALLFLYTRLIAKRKLINESLGLGDVLFFFAIGMGFPSITFLVLFATSLLFSLCLFFATKRLLHERTVPLAGFMSLFFIIAIGYSVFFDQPSLYLY